MPVFEKYKQRNESAFLSQTEDEEEEEEEEELGILGSQMVLLHIFHALCVQIICLLIINCLFYAPED